MSPKMVVIHQPRIPKVKTIKLESNKLINPKMLLKDNSLFIFVCLLTQKIQQT